MLQNLEKFQSQIIKNPASGLEIYCREEGMNALYIRRTMKKEKSQKKESNNKNKSALESMFSKLVRRPRTPRLSDFRQ